MKKILWGMCILIISNLSFANSYRNQLQGSETLLLSQEGNKIFLTAKDFESGYEGASQVNTAEQIQVRVSGPELKISSVVRAVIVPNCWSETNNWPIEQPSLFADLKPIIENQYVGFSAKFDGTVMTRSAIHGGEKISCYPHISVVVDDQWQTDTINGTHNFKLIHF